MAGYLDVDIDVLTKTVTSLRAAEQTLTDAMSAMAKDGRGDIGTTQLNDAAESFQRRWKYGIERIGEAAKVTADGVDRCRVAYQELDRTVASAINKTEDALPGGAGQPAQAPA